MLSAAPSWHLNRASRSPGSCLVFNRLGISNLIPLRECSVPFGSGFELHMVSTQWSTARSPVESHTLSGVVSVKVGSIIITRGPAASPPGSEKVILWRVSSSVAPPMAPLNSPAERVVETVMKGIVEGFTSGALAARGFFALRSLLALKRRSSLSRVRASFAKACGQISIVLDSLPICDNVCNWSRESYKDDSLRPIHNTSTSDSNDTICPGLLDLARDLQHLRVQGVRLHPNMHARNGLVAIVQGLLQLLDGIRVLVQRIRDDEKRPCSPQGLGEMPSTCLREGQAVRYDAQLLVWVDPFDGLLGHGE